MIFQSVQFLPSIPWDRAVDRPVPSVSPLWDVLCPGVSSLLGTLQHRWGCKTYSEMATGRDGGAGGLSRCHSSIPIARTPLATPQPHIWRQRAVERLASLQTRDGISAQRRSNKDGTEMSRVFSWVLQLSFYLVKQIEHCQLFGIW